MVSWNFEVSKLSFETQIWSHFGDYSRVVSECFGSNFVTSGNEIFRFSFPLCIWDFMKFARANSGFVEIDYFGFHRRNLRFRKTVYGISTTCFGTFCSSRRSAVSWSKLRKNCKLMWYLVLVLVVLKILVVLYYIIFTHE